MESLLQVKDQLRRSLIGFRLSNAIDDVLDMLCMCAAYVLVVLFHIIALVLVGFEALFQLLEIQLMIDFFEGLRKYYTYCMEEIEERADAISVLCQKIANETPKIERLAKAALNVDNVNILAPSGYITIIEKIQLTREERKECGTHVSSFLLFVLRAIAFIA